MVKRESIVTSKRVDTRVKENKRNKKESKRVDTGVKENKWNKKESKRDS